VSNENTTINNAKGAGKSSAESDIAAVEIADNATRDAAYGPGEKNFPKTDPSALSLSGNLCYDSLIFYYKNLLIGKQYDGENICRYSGQTTLSGGGDVILGHGERMYLTEQMSLVGNDDTQTSGGAGPKRLAGRCHQRRQQ